MNMSITKTLDSPLQMYSNLKFDPSKSSTLKAGATVTLEETGKLHVDEEGLPRKVFRIRKNTRNYYVLGDTVL
jgi:hypothetical protein